MRNRITLTASVATLAVAMLVPAAPSGADENIWGECPDGYVPVAGIFVDEDRNGNGVVCVKLAGTNAIIHDDPSGQRYRCNGFPVPPAECIADPDGPVFAADDALD